MDAAGYSTREVASLLDIPVAEVRAIASALRAPKGPRGEYRFSFQDLVLLRTARGLVASKVPVRTIRASLERLRQQLPEGQPLTTVKLAAAGNEVAVQEGGAFWSAESGQALFDFAVAGSSAPTPAPEATVPPPAAFPARREPEEATAESLFARGCELEASDPVAARDAYREALKLDGKHARARLNLGRLLHQERLLPAAEHQYRLALEAEPGNLTAGFNLGVVLEDQGRVGAAIRAYEAVLSSAPDFAAAHYNVALLYERAGKKAAAIRHFKAYKMLTPEDR
jgi:tetratricopeptide (TPR) repeat protein